MKSLLGAALVISALGACGDSEGAPPDASTVPLCGPGPHVTFTAELVSFLDPSFKIAGAQVQVDLCPEVELVTDETGVVQFALTTGVEFNTTIRAEGFIPLRQSVEVLQDYYSTKGLLFSEDLAPLFPGLTQDSPAIVAAHFLEEGGPIPMDAPDACRTAAGTTFSIAGHPEAQVVYYADGQIPTQDTSLEATSEAGIAEITGLEETAPGETLTLEFSKPGCDLASMVSYPHLDRVTLSNGVMTAVGVFIPPVEWPDGDPPS